MMRRLLFPKILLLLLISISGFSQNYHAASITDSLKEKAVAVIRNHEEVLTIVDKGKASYSVKHAITILSKGGDKYSNLIIYYNGFRKVRNITGTVYDANNKIIKRIKQKDIKDVSNVSDFSLYEENRVKYVEQFVNTYPYTVVYEYTIDYKGILHFPVWWPQPSSDISVEKSTLRVISNKSVSFRYKQQNISEAPKITEKGNEKHTIWTVHNIKAFEPEPMAPPSSDYMPFVMLAPDWFEIEGYEGVMSDWQRFGEWLMKINTNRDNLPEETKQELKTLIGTEKDKYIIAKKLYEYLQNKVRYVSIQLGIGGWQPFDAEIVDKNSYGDCKALSNYMYTLLKAFDIESHYTVVKAGKGKANIFTDFPCSQFNHAILCIPFDGDTTYLECTDTDSPFGYIGNFTDDRDVLIVTPEGGKIVHTTVYPDTVNTQTRTINAIIDENGDLKTKVTTNYQGLQYDNVSWLAEQSKEDQEKRLYKRIGIPNMSIHNFGFELNKNRIPLAVENIEFSTKKFASKTGNRMFLKLNVLNNRTFIPKELDKRERDIMQNYAFVDCDTVIFEIPNSYSVEYKPENKTLKTKFGTYGFSVSQQENKIIYIRKVHMYKKRFDAEKYDNLIAFYKEMVNSDKEKMVLKKKAN